MPRAALALIALVVATAALSTPRPAAAAHRPAAAARPNILFVLTDDMTRADLHAMPGVERAIGRHGMQFTRALVSVSLCCPSRTTHPARAVRPQHRRGDERRHERRVRVGLPVRGRALHHRDVAAPRRIPHGSHRQVPQRLPEHRTGVLSPAGLDGVGDTGRRQPLQRVRLPTQRERAVRRPRLHAGRLRDHGLHASRTRVHRTRGTRAPAVLPGPLPVRAAPSGDARAAGRGPLPRQPAAAPSVVRRVRHPRQAALAAVGAADEPARRAALPGALQPTA